MEKHMFLQRLAEGPVLFDGGMGSQLIDRGLNLSEGAESWNLKHPDRVQDIHRSYFEAGADVVLTNTFGGSSPKLQLIDLDDQVSEVNRIAAILVKEICPEGKFVAGDVGPSGQLIKPYGPRTIEDLTEAFAEQAAALAEGGADIIIIETMFDIQEYRAAILGAQQACSLPIIACMTFEKTPRGFFSMMGIKPADMVKEAEQLGIQVVGANCTISIEDMVELVPLIREATALPILVQPNAGKPQLVEGKTVYQQTPENFAEKIPDLLAAGANAVGGCCGTTPEFIRKMREVIDRL